MEKSQMKLIAPSIEYDEQIQAYRNEFLVYGGSMDGDVYKRQHRSTACIAEIASSSVPYRPSRKKFEVQYEWQRKTAAPARKEGRDNA